MCITIGTIFCNSYIQHGSHHHWKQEKLSVMEKSGNVMAFYFCQNSGNMYFKWRVWDKMTFRLSHQN